MCALAHAHATGMCNITFESLQPLMKRIPHRWVGDPFHGGDGEIRVHFFAGEGAAPRIAGLVRKNRGIVQCAHWTMKLPPAVSIMIRISPTTYEKDPPPLGGGSFSWRRWRDSNSRRAFDPYTISNRARSTNYATSPCCSRKLFVHLSA